MNFRPRDYYELSISYVIYGFPINSVLFNFIKQQYENLETCLKSKIKNFLFSKDCNYRLKEKYR